MQINQFHLGRMRVNAIASLDFNSGLTCFLIDLFHFQLHMQQINGEMFMFFFICLIDHNFFFTQFLKSDTPKISIQRDLMSPVAQIDWFLFFNEFFFLLNIKHKFIFHLIFLVWIDGDAFAYAIRVTAFYALLTFFLCCFKLFFFEFFFSQTFFTSFKLFVESRHFNHNYFEDFNTFRRFIDIISLLFGK